MADRAMGGAWLLAAISIAFAGFALAAIAAPLAAYTLALAAFGLPHVLSELRYVDHRFGRRIGGSRAALAGLILAAIVAVRALTVFGILPVALGVTAELAGVAALALAVVSGATAAGRLLALAVATCIGFATLVDPFSSATVLAVLHNVTPLAFMWQLLPRERRVGGTLIAAIPLLALPLLAATGAPRMALAALGNTPLEADPLGAGPLASHLHAYIPSFWTGSSHAIDLFSAAVVAQGAHYLAVIVVLPLMLTRIEPGARGLIRWPAAPRFALLCAAAGAASIAVFLKSGFAEARALYGIAAALHAWLEIPVLILALTGGLQARSTPPSADAALAKSSASIGCEAANI